MKFWVRRSATPALDAVVGDDVARELGEYHLRLGLLLEDALAFWMQAVDWRNGGFFGKIDYEGQPLVDAPKHLVQQARHLWTFAHVYRLHAGSEDIARVCHHQFKFIRDRLYRPAERDFYTVVSAHGQPLGRGTHHYLLSFVLFGLSSYALAFASEPAGRDALDIAKAVFARIRQESYHPVHGFDERVYPSRWCRHAKEINTQMHLLEAITELYEACVLLQDESAPAIRDILHRQLDHVYLRGIVRMRGRYSCSRGYREDWKLTTRKEVDYGHDIEVVYLAMTAAKVLGRDAEGPLRKRLVRLGRSVTRDALDPQHGKWFYSGDPRSGEVFERVSNIWTNFEALNGLFTLWELTGEPHFLEKFGGVLTWLETRQLNTRTREWYYNVDDEGNPVDVDVFGNPCGWMTFEWKSSYHSLRALISRRLRIERLLGRTRAVRAR